MHFGVQWIAPLGTPVLAAEGGQVVLASFSGEHGNVILIEHGPGWRSVYAHLSTVNVRQGDCVERGAVIGTTGATGLVADPGLYFEVRHNGTPVDPLLMLPQNAR
jgi:murein DD-endopeptidase MepM/ murein hydrolase activator NlpD